MFGVKGFGVKGLGFTCEQSATRHLREPWRSKGFEIWVRGDHGFAVRSQGSCRLRWPYTPNPRVLVTPNQNCTYKAPPKSPKSSK